MAKLSGKKNAALKQPRPRPVRAPVRTVASLALTREGGAGFTRDAKSDLYLLGITNMVSEKTFYEDANVRDARFVDLVHQVTLEDPEWMAGFIPYLRSEMFMRTASVVAAAEYVAIGGPHGRSVVRSALQRADEPAEILGYWHTVHGRNEPKPLKRGVADAVQRLYREDSALKYDGGSRAIRMGDVIERVHPTPVDENQAAVFEYLLDRRHHPDKPRVEMEMLPRIKKARKIDALTPEQLRKFLAKPGALDDSGYTWERLSGNTAMDKLAWEAVIPQMGYMALLKNLRNFSDAKISTKSQKYVIDVLTDPKRVAKGMQFPYRYYSAYKATQDIAYLSALETALDLSTQNIPLLKGRTLILVDVSGSMQEEEGISPWEKGALFGVAQFKKSEKADVVAFATHASKVDLHESTSVLRGVDAIRNIVDSGRLQHGTNAFQTLKEHYNGQDRVIIFTDLQSTRLFHGGQDFLTTIPAIYNFNLAGYAVANMELGTGRYEFGGFSDAAFRMIGMIEAAKSTTWPWEQSG